MKFLFITSVLTLSGCVPITREHVNHGWVQLTEDESNCHWEMRAYRMRWICHV